MRICYFDLVQPRNRKKKNEHEIEVYHPHSIAMILLYIELYASVYIACQKSVGMSDERSILQGRVDYEGLAVRQLPLYELGFYVTIILRVNR